MFYKNYILHTTNDEPLFLWFEPWGDGIAAPAGITVQIEAKSEINGELEIVTKPESTTVYGWGGSTISVLFDNNLVKSFDLPAPNFLTSKMVTSLFGEPPVPTDEEKEKASGIGKGLNQTDQIK